MALAHVNGMIGPFELPAKVCEPLNFFCRSLKKLSATSRDVWTMPVGSCGCADELGLLSGVLRTARKIPSSCPIPAPCNRSRSDRFSQMGSHNSPGCSSLRSELGARTR